MEILSTEQEDISRETSKSTWSDAKPSEIFQVLKELLALRIVEFTCPVLVARIGVAGQ